MSFRTIRLNGMSPAFFTACSFSSFVRRTVNGVSFMSDSIIHAPRQRNPLTLKFQNGATVFQSLNHSPVRPRRWRATISASFARWRLDGSPMSVSSPFVDCPLLAAFLRGLSCFAVGGLMPVVIVTSSARPFPFAPLPGHRP